MTRRVTIELVLPDELKMFRFPKGLDRRLQELLDKNNDGLLSRKERAEAEGLVQVAQALSLLKLKVERAVRQSPRGP